MPKPLRVLTKDDIQRIVELSPYSPLIADDKLATIVAVVLSVAKANGVMIVRADPDDFRLHLKFLTDINWTP